MKLSLSSKKYLLFFVLLQAVILLFAIFLTSFLINNNKHRGVSLRHRQELIRLLKDLRRNPHRYVSDNLNHKQKPWLKIEASDKPKNKILMWGQLRHYFRKSMRRERLTFSFKAEDTWFNIDVNWSKEKPAGIMFALTGLFLFCLGLLFALSLLLIRKLSYPIVTLLKSLDYAKTLKVWQPIPLVGGEDENKIFDKVNQLQEKVNKLLQDRTHMLASISHDLRTPLTRIKLRLENITEHESYPKLMRDIGEMEQMLAESIDYFRDISHEEINQKFELGSLIEAVVNDLATPSIAVSFKAQVNEAIFEGKMNLLKRAINNVLSNAIKYGQQASVTLSEDHREYIVEVVDSGPGIEEDDPNKVFEPYYRENSSHIASTRGTGLGLTIAKEIILLHRGHISLSNLKSSGLKVTIKLPKSE